MALSEVGLMSKAPSAALRSFREQFVDTIKGTVTEAINSLGNFLGELQTHLTSMEQISGKIAEVDFECGKRLLTVMKDVSSLQNYWATIYIRTKGVVDYGTGGTIFEIQTKIKQKLYCEATDIMKSFLDHLKNRIKKVENSIDKMKQDHGDSWIGGIEATEEKMNNTKDDYDVDKGQLDTDIQHAQAKQVEVFKLGVSSFFYLTMGTVVGSFLVSVTPGTPVGAVMKQITEQVGTEIISFSYGNVLKGLHAVTSASKVPADLQKKVESNASKVRDCLAGFFKQIAHLEIKIKTVITGIDNLKEYNNELGEELQSKPISEKNIADWESISATLDEINETLMYLKCKVVDKEEHKKLMETIDEAMNTLASGVDNVSLGTAV